MRTLKSQRGLSLVEVIIGAAILTIVAAAFSSLMINMQHGQNGVKYRIDADNFNEEMRTDLSSPAACINTFGGLLASTAPLAISNILDDSAPAVVRYTAGGTYGDNSLVLSGMKLQDFIAGATSLKAQMTLHNSIATKRTALGGQSVDRTITLALDLDGSGKIIACIALAKMSDGIWQRNKDNINNIFYRGGSPGGYVGIGTQSPSYPLDINTGTAPAGLTGARIEGNSPAGGVGLVIANDIASGNSWSVVSEGGSSAPVGSFGIYDNALPGERLVILNNGNVGIGTVNPQSALQVKSGYMQIPTISISPPPSADCTSADHEGRITIWLQDNTHPYICFCPQALGVGHHWWCAQAGTMIP
jgi:prepilin-type N-terminal cleavage/methylation domain-containing protein